jgi:hypothetical protein
MRISALTHFRFEHPLLFVVFLHASHFPQSSVRKHPIQLPHRGNSAKMITFQYLLNVLRSDFRFTFVDEVLGMVVLDDFREFVGGGS